MMMMQFEADGFVSSFYVVIMCNDKLSRYSYLYQNIVQKFLFLVLLLMVLLSVLKII